MKITKHQLSQLLFASSSEVQTFDFLTGKVQGIFQGVTRESGNGKNFILHILVLWRDEGFLCKDD